MNRRKEMMRDFDADVRDHIARETQDNIDRGMTLDEARRAAMLKFGNVTRVKEDTRSVWSFVWLEALLQDVRYGLRMLRKSPGFTAVAILTLALGIGANAAIFSVIDAVLLRPLPYDQPDRLVMVYQAAPQRGVQKNGMSYPNYQDWARSASSFEEMAAMRTTQFALSGTGDATNVLGGAVTSGYFPIFRVTPMLGRTLAPTDDVPGAAAVVVLSEQLWRGQFGSDPSILGKTVRLDQHPFTIVGIVPGNFRPPVPIAEAQLWVPLLQDSIAGQLYQRRGGHYLRAMGRLKANVTVAQAQSQLDSIEETLQKQYPADNKGWDARIIPLQEDLVGSFRLALVVLLGAVSLVFLIACANVASLLLARVTSRQREVAIRTALGAGRMRLLQQFLAEYISLGLAGGLVGLAVVAAMVQGLRAWLPADLPRISEIRVDSHVLGFGMALAILSGLIFGLAPAWRSGKERFGDALKDGARGAGDDPGRRRLRNALVVVETALAVMLLVGSGLLIRSFMRLQRLDPGFNPSHLLMAGVSLPDSRYSTPQKTIAFYNALLQRVSALPGASYSAAVIPPPLGGYINLGFQVEGAPQLAQSEEPNANFVAVSPNYFRAMQIPLMRGREFSSSDSDSAPKVCVISQTVARSVFGNANPLGKRIIIGYPSSVPREVVGIVGDVKDMGLASQGVGQLYVPFVQNPLGGLSVVIRTRGDAAQLSSAVRSDIRAIDPGLPVEIDSMSDMIGSSITEPRFRTTLLALFGAVALLLAAIGIYGVISYSTGLRTREIGIRIALGAQRRDILRLIVAQGAGLALAGLLFGLAGAWGLSRYVASLLFHVSVTDPVTYASVALVLMAVASTAAYIPARRAMRVDPMVALRYE
jgi:putative ABC transport system permease protein